MDSHNVLHNTHSLCTGRLHGITGEALPARKAAVRGHKYDCHSEALLELVPGGKCVVKRTSISGAIKMHPRRAGEEGVF